MPNIPFYADLHVHSTLRPFRYDPVRTISESIPRDDDPNYIKQLPLILEKMLGGLLKEYSVPSQANLDRCREAKVRVAALSLYPPERNLFDLRKFIKFILGRNAAIFGAAFTLYEKQSIEKYLEVVDNNLPVDYCLELEAEYNYLLAQSNSSPVGQELIIAEDFQHLQQKLSSTASSTVVILTIEGLHSLAKYDSYDDLINYKDFPNDRTSELYLNYRNQFATNINSLKQWNQGKHCPLFITFAHHFWNLLCGHARSFAGIIRKMAVNQECGRNRDFTALGLEVMDMLLSRDNGRQILIDIKHMSAKARQSFYEIRKRKYVEKDNPFPIICSHAAVSGIATLQEAIRQKDLERDIEQSYFNLWSINLCDRDIMEIFDSHGIIGIVLHEDRLPGGIPKHKIKGYKQVGDQDKLRDEYLQLIMSNIFHIVRTCNDLKAWDIICLGSDFDGAINAMQTYPDVTAFNLLSTHMVQYLHRPLINNHLKDPLDADEMNRLRFGLSVDQIVEKIMFKNMMAFLEKYFNEDYLSSGNRPPVV